MSQFPLVKQLIDGCERGSELRVVTNYWDGNIVCWIQDLQSLLRELRKLVDRSAEYQLIIDKRKNRYRYADDLEQQAKDIKGWKAVTFSASGNPYISHLQSVVRKQEERIEALEETMDSVRGLLNV